MKKQLIVFLIILALVFTCAFDETLNTEEQPPSGDGYVEVLSEQGIAPQLPPENQADPDTDGNDQFQQQDIFEQPSEDDQSDQSSQEQPDGSGQTVEQPEPVSDPPAPSYEGIESGQLEILQSLYNEMTVTGRTYSGWFTDYTPCNWREITCEDGQVTGLKFEGVGYFTVFPSSVLSLHDLKSLAFIDTLMRGPLPDSLFADLPELEKLELRGNYLTGEIPSLPDSYSPLKELVISDNRDDEDNGRKAQLLLQPEYADVAYFQLSEYDYPDIDLEPGLDGNIPENWSALSSLYKIDLSGNQLTGSVPDSFANLYSLTALDLSNNGDTFRISDWLYDSLSNAAQNYPSIILDGIQKPVVEEVPVADPEQQAIEVSGVEEPGQENNSEDTIQPDFQLMTLENQNPGVTDPVSQEGPGTESDFQVQTYPDMVPTETPYIPPTEIPYVAPTEVPNILPTEIPYVAPTEVPNIPPTEVPYVAPTEVPYIPPTEIPYVAPTEVPYIPPTEVPYVAPTEVPYIPPTEVPYIAPTQVPPTAQTVIIVVTATPVPQWYTATPQSYYPTQQPYIYPTATPYYPLYYSYPTATPYTYYNPNWVYPTATSAYSYNYVPQYQSSTQVPTILPTQDQAALLGFTYKLEAMTENNIPMTWRYTGMQEYSIVYLDASGNLYPAFAMEWKPASEVCNASVCNGSVSVPDELLQQGRFSLQLRVRDAAGKIYQSDPVEMEVSLPPQPTPTPAPEQPKSLLGGFFAWLFGPIIRLFGGGK